ncbi:MAG: hypothetical protein KAJ36_01845, partial [Candidatus Thorarchaeota archaeon]|nr:hypothetical protein [Candidatus Thorarchaeota archaeon]
GYGFFILVAAMSKLRSPFQLIPITACIGTGIGLWYLVDQGLIILGAASQTVIAIAVITVITFIMLLIPSMKAT